MSSLGFLAGVLALYQLHELPPVAFCGVIILAIPLHFIVPRLALVTSFAVGFSWALWQADRAMQHRLPLDLAGQDVLLVGSISSVPEAGRGSVRFSFAPQQWPASLDGRDLPRNIRVNWYRDFPDLRAGEVWRLTLRLKPPRGFMNPGGFDYETFLFREHIDATAYVRNAPVNARLQPAGMEMNSLRQTIEQRIREAGSRSDVSGLVSALTVGLRSGLSDAQWQVFRETGTSHLMAISGLHIGLLAALGFGIARWLWRFCASCCLRLPAPRAGAVIAMLFAVGYAALAGFSVPTQRALVMLTVVMFALLISRSVRPAQTLSLALVLVLLLDSSAVLSPGFWLSFLAVAAILWVTLNRKQWSWWRQMLLIQGALSLLLMPVTGWFFGEASLISPLANLFAVPLVTFLLVPLSLLSVALLLVWLPAGQALLQLTLWVAELIFAVLQWFAALPFSAVSLAGIELWQVILLGAGGLILFRQRGRYRLVAVPLLLLPLLATTRTGVLESGVLRVTFLDVGQGLSVVLRTQNRTLVFDTGARFSDSFSAASSVVLPYLQEQGVDKIDTLVLSHDDLDHAGGAEEILRRIPVGEVLSSFQPAYLQHAATRCQALPDWHWDGVTFAVLHPEQDWQGGDNDQSCVLRASVDNGPSVLLTGDIALRSERALLQRSRAALASTILQVAHHGSNTSSGEAFLQAVEPQFAVVSAGFLNRFGFPAEAVSQRLQQSGAEILRTDLSGAVIFELRAGVAVAPVTLWRIDSGRFWHLSD